MLLVKGGRSADDAERLVDSLVSDHRDGLDAGDQVMIDYALKLTHTPAAMTAVDVDSLRRAGFDDRAIHDICSVTAYFAFVNRIADGLGVELEEGR